MHSKAKISIAEHEHLIGRKLTPEEAQIYTEAYYAGMKQMYTDAKKLFLKKVG